MFFALYPMQGISVHIQPYGSPHYISAHTVSIVTQPGTMRLIELQQKEAHVFTYLLH